MIRRAIVVASVVVLASGVARAEALAPIGLGEEPTRFIFQPTIAIGTTFAAASTGTTDTAAPPSTSSTLIPIARLGVQFSAFAVLLSASYNTAGVQGKEVDTLVHVAALVEPTLWRSADTRTRLYLLAGLGAVLIDVPVVSTDGINFTSASNTGFSGTIGLGGQRALDPSLALGLEVFAQADVVGSGPYIESAMFVAFTGTFTTGH